MYLLPGTRLFRVPDELPSQIAALTEVMAVTNGLDTALSFGDTVLVLGVGPLGLMHLAKAEMLGAGRLIAIDVLPERLEHARAFGADTTLDVGDDRRGAPRPGTEATAARRRRRRRLPGRAETFPEALGLVRPGGTVVGPGVRRLGPVPVNPNRDVCSPGVAILGIGGETLPQYAPALRMRRAARRPAPFARAVAHSVALEAVGDALETAKPGRR
jgi:L-iditol 2-dehydrogenase